MDLGQVFTTSVIAEYMVSLFSLSQQSKVLEPCFGNGAFLDALVKHNIKQIYGFEIDEKLFNQVKAKYSHLNLFLKNFFSSKYENYFDGVILNPPYVRQEKIDEMAPLGVSKAILKKDNLFEKLPDNANLYMYFVLKAISMLKKKGELVVIFPASWMQAKNGKYFSDELTKECSVVREIHISGPVFVKKALVDVVILKLCKDGLSFREEPEYKRLVNGSVEPVNRNKTKRTDLFAKVDSFTSLASAKRGVTTGFNSFFINPKVGKTKKILSSPKQVLNYSTATAESDEILAVKKIDLNRNSKLLDYVSDAERCIVEEEKPKVLLRKIQSNEVWYELNFFDCMGIIFSYFVRDDMKFIMNKTFSLVRDNFYIIQPKIDEWLFFGLLNNVYSYYQLELLGKKYGAGLLKIQRYDLDLLKFPALKAMSNEDKNRIRSLAKKLADTSNSKLIRNISEVVAKYAMVPLASVQKKYNAEKKNRLELV